MAERQNRRSANREIPVKIISDSSPIEDKPLYQRIAEKAHELYQCRGCCHGRDVDDWLEAEQLVLREVGSQAHGEGKNPRGRAQRSKKG